MLNSDAQQAEYFPNHINPSTVTRSFLLSLLFKEKREKYVALYNLYKNKMKQSSIKGGKLYSVLVAESFINYIKNFVLNIK